MIVHATLLPNMTPNGYLFPGMPSWMGIALQATFLGIIGALWVRAYLVAKKRKG